MRNLIALIPTTFLDYQVFGCISLRTVFPLFVLGIFAAILFTPIFPVLTFHAFTAMKYIQHLYFDSIAGFGGYYASGFCKHTKHRIGIMLLIDLLATLLLVTLVG